MSAPFATEFAYGLSALDDVPVAIQRMVGQLLGAYVYTVDHLLSEEQRAMLLVYRMENGWPLSDEQRARYRAAHRDDEDDRGGVRTEEDEDAHIRAAICQETQCRIADGFYRRAPPFWYPPAPADWARLGD